jgi:hypothetical protein
MSEERPEHEWAKQLVCDWAAHTQDVALLQAWLDACRSRLSQLNAPRRGIPLEIGNDVVADGKQYVIARVERLYTSDQFDVSTLGGARKKGLGVETETVRLELRRRAL